MLCHSHAGTIVPTAVLSSRDVRIPALVTLGTPVRQELEVLYQRMMLSGRVGRWLHVYATGDPWQWWGSRPTLGRAWRPSAWRTERRMRWASDNVDVGRGVRHADLVDPAILARAGVWRWLTPG
jgi:hypothetical protein